MRNLALVLLLSAPLAHAGPLTIKDRTSDFTADDPIGGPILDAMNSVADNLEASVNNGFLSTASRQGTLDAMAKASVSQTSGLGADLSSNPSIFVIGVGGQGNINSSGGSLALSLGENSLPAFGITAQPTVMLGMNLGGLGVGSIGPIVGRRLTLYANFFSYTLDVGQFSASSTNFGFHPVYKIVDSRRAGWAAGWGGIDFLFGFDYSKIGAAFATTLNIQQQTAITGGETVTISYNSPIEIGLESSTFTIPLQVSTNADLLYLLGFFCGGGMDLNFGTTKFTGKSSGPVTAAYSGTLSATNVFSGTAELDMEADGLSASPPIAVGRFFGGMQFNFWGLKIVGQGNYFTNGTFGGTAALRFSL